MKNCLKCNLPKKLFEFAKNANAKDGLQAWCRQCSSDYSKERNKKEEVRNKSRDTRLKRIYDIDLEEYHDLLDLQNGVCAICSKKDNRLLSIDHDHRNEKIRGLLCKHCNSALGLFEDNPHNLLNAFFYLVKSDNDWERFIPHKYVLNLEEN